MLALFRLFACVACICHNVVWAFQSTVQDSSIHWHPSMVADHILEEHDVQSNTIYGYRRSTGQAFYKSDEAAQYVPKKLKLHSAYLMNEQCKVLTILGRSPNGMLSYEWQSIDQSDQTLAFQTWEFEAQSPWAKTLKKIHVKSNLYPSFKCECAVDTNDFGEYRHTMAKKIESCTWKLVKSITNLESQHALQELSQFDIRTQNCQPLGSALSNAHTVLPISVYDKQVKQLSKSLEKQSCRSMFDLILADHRQREQEESNPDIQLPTATPGQMLADIKASVALIEISQQMYHTIGLVMQTLVSHVLKLIRIAELYKAYPSPSQFKIRNISSLFDVYAYEQSRCLGVYDSQLQSMLQTEHVSMTPHNANITFVTKAFVLYALSVAECILPVVESYALVSECSLVAILGQEHMNAYVNYNTKAMFDVIIPDGSPDTNSIHEQLYKLQNYKDNPYDKNNLYTATDETIKVIRMQTARLVQVTLKVISFYSATKETLESDREQTVQSVWCCASSPHLTVQLLNFTHKTDKSVPAPALPMCSTLMSRKIEQAIQARG